MNKGPLRLGYVGCGFMAQHVHLPNFASLEGGQLLALAEARPQLGQKVAATYSIPRVYASHLELAADPDIDAVGVSAGFALQGEIAADLLRAGKHVFMEKPMAVSIAQAERMLAAAREGKARLMVAYMKRYDPGNILARQTIARWQASGEMGETLYARAHGFCGNWISTLDRSRMIGTDEQMPPAPFREQLPAWLPEDHAKGYINYLQQYTHNINLLRYLLGAGHNAQVSTVSLDSDGLTGIVMLDVGGTRAVIESGSLAYHHWDEHTQIYFQKAWLHLWAQPLFTKPAQSRLEIYEGAERTYSYPTPEPLTSWNYRDEATHFIQCLQSGEEFHSSGEDTLTDVRLFEDIYRKLLGIA